VATPSPEVFAITKRKFHNVLQGVAPGTPPFCAKDQDEDAEALPCATANPAPILNAGPRERVSKWALLRNMFRACGGLPATTRLLEEDKRKFLEWTRMNVERHWDDPDGPIMKSDVIIIDDPQRESHFLQPTLCSHTHKYFGLVCDLFTYCVIVSILPSLAACSEWRDPVDPQAEPVGQGGVPLAHRDPR
jgi:hypothetical protein